MPVYVDNARIPYGRMVMSHMLADTPAELLAMAKKIGLDTKYLQNGGQPNEHFDVSATYREKAIKAGAKEIDGRGLVKLIRAKRLGRAKEVAQEVLSPAAQDALGIAEEPEQDEDEDKAPPAAPDTQEDDHAPPAPAPAASGRVRVTRKPTTYTDEPEDTID